MKAKEEGTFADFMEAFKTFDREGQGYISAAELRHVLTSYGERLDDSDVDVIMKFTDTHRGSRRQTSSTRTHIKKVQAGRSHGQEGTLGHRRQAASTQRRALRWFARHASQPDDSLTLINRGGAAADSARRRDPLAGGVAAVRQLRVRHAEGRLGLDGAGARFLEKISNSPGAAIVEVANELHADLVVLGNRGMGTAALRPAPSLSGQRVRLRAAHMLTSPVLIVPHNASTD
uniref:EF-hand domain-containing protein n=1 Tax=Macrostomum lignano TaxID=282301 RepID=A0A1I8JSD6_9PLAT